WNQLANETWITTRPGTAGAESLQRLCARAGFDPQIGFRSNDYDVVREFVRSGLGVALVPSLCGGAIHGTVPLPNENIEFRRRVSVLMRRDVSNPIISGFMSALRKATFSIESEYVRAVRN